MAYERELRAIVISSHSRSQPQEPLIRVRSASAPPKALALPAVAVWRSDVSAGHIRALLVLTENPQLVVVWNSRFWVFCCGGLGVLPSASNAIFFFVSPSHPRPKWPKWPNYTDSGKERFEQTCEATKGSPGTKIGPRSEGASDW